MKSFLKRLLQYRPLPETDRVRTCLATFMAQYPGRPFCPPWEGDLIHSLITANGFARCLETGFGTGSSALYMLEATRAVGGHVTSIDWSDSNFNAIGKALLEGHGSADRHTLVESPSYLAMAELLLNNSGIDFIFIDGWKSFDYLTYECFIINRLMTVGGVVMFDDSYLPSVRKVISLLKRHYGYEEVVYANETLGLRLWQILTTRRLSRPYRALRKTIDVAEQKPTRDWTFFARF